MRDEPSRGEVRLMQLRGQTIIAYRPAAEYEGSDRFRVTLGTGRGDDIIVDAQVNVTK